MRRVLEEFENGSEEELSDDEMDERVRARQRENEAAGRPRGGGLQHRQAILAEFERERRDRIAEARAEYEEAAELLEAMEAGELASGVEPPPDGIATPVRPEPYEGMFEEDRN